MIPPEAQELAERNAAEDLDLLARLVASGRVRVNRSEATTPAARALVRSIDRRVAAMRPGADTIRPNKKKGRKSRRG